MKNRTIIGIICMVLAVVITFAVAPLVNRLSSDTSTVIRLAEDIKQGAQITEAQIESVKVKTDTIPAGTIKNSKEVIGKYAASDLYAGDYFTAAKISGESNTADDVFASLDGSKVAVSVTIDTFAAGLSGKLQNGDIISIIVTDNNTKESAIPGELRYVKVITTTTAGGIDKDAVVKTMTAAMSFRVPSQSLLIPIRQNCWQNTRATPLCRRRLFTAEERRTRISSLRRRMNILIMPEVA